MGKEINKSLTVAFDILKAEKKNLDFKQLWNKVSVQNDYGKNDTAIMAEFYTSLLLDKRFHMIGNNVWGLRNNYKFKDIVVEIESVYNDDIDLKDESDSNIDDLLPEEILELEEEKLDASKLPYDIDPLIDHSDDDISVENNDDKDDTGFKEIIINE